MYIVSAEGSEYENTPTSIKYHVKKYLIANKERIKDKVVVDFPAGNGITSKIVQELGGKPIPFDLFPEYFKLKDVECRRVNANENIPMNNTTADFVICQEGIEHFADQYKILKEFNRILKKNGSLIITTPNYSNLRSRLSYFLSESERSPSMMPPNEVDSIWMSNKNISSEFYFGHVFLIGIPKLRLLAKLSGFHIQYIQFTRLKLSSLILLLVTYPFIVIANCLSYFKNIRKRNSANSKEAKKIYREILKLSLNPKILVDGHIFIEFMKERDSNEVIGGVSNVHAEFGIT